ncbi:hypothetical protein JZ751_027379 [Albula glossodonta]|uniref:Uncharacterized protein n=1 Tax=Albula glossodonta TaxID=121402 RepID=A0A8T2MPM4_9TELE|nr:hypothetical protein JZ751_027379 [Albula glossodonta]
MASRGGGGAVLSSNSGSTSSETNSPLSLKALTPPPEPSEAGRAHQGRSGGPGLPRHPTHVSDPHEDLRLSPAAWPLPPPGSQGPPDFPGRGLFQLQLGSFGATGPFPLPPVTPPSAIGAIGGFPVISPVQHRHPLTQ